jgi:hypothetical protein
VSVIRKLLAKFKRREIDPDELAASREANFDRETIKTGAFDAPPMMQGTKWPRE